ncbi:type II secretion system F family protein [Microbacterium amylolyticum]|uniref:Tight adherence protein B n=1 Tax=Microbacterium amylolyticum TaxID=936337 RepID=A0ABS4ZKK5_9MICO|nr:type II secretion system F family protein [Microbacterium amylolyticum]MBP2437809.1 tight adherence protein B [Microbacterium amylolyticum]
MTLLLGCVLAAGLLLAASPWMWPAGASTEPRTRRVGAVASSARTLLDRAGFAHVEPRILVVACVASAVVAAALAFVMTTAGVLAVLAAIAAACAPVAWLRARASRLLRARRGMWPDVCDLLVGSVRAGLSLPDAIGSLSDSAPAPLRATFGQFERDMRASGHFATSINRLKQQLADPMADRIVETLRMAREVGGTELVPVLRALSASIRAEAALRSEVEARQSWTRGAAILGVVAPWVVLAMLSLRPEGQAAYATPLGITIILSGAGVSVVAYRTMLRVGRLPEPRRWFA